MQRKVALGALMLWGCSVVHDDVDALLARGQAAEALRRLSADEAALAHDDAAGQARYGLRRGLSHLALGDRPSARWWLRHAKERLDVDPRALDALDRARLLDALRGL